MSVSLYVTQFFECQKSPVFGVVLPKNNKCNGSTEKDKMFIICCPKVILADTKEDLFYAGEISMLSLIFKVCKKNFISKLNFSQLSLI